MEPCMRLSPLLCFDNFMMHSVHACSTRPVSSASRYKYFLLLVVHHLVFLIPFTLYPQHTSPLPASVRLCTLVKKAFGCRRFCRFKAVVRTKDCSVHIHLPLRLVLSSSPTLYTGLGSRRSLKPLPCSVRIFRCEIYLLPNH